MSRKKHKGGHEEEVHMDERWIVSYADILTLLLALFIVMFAMSKVDAAKFKAFAEGAADAFGTNQVIQGKTGISDGGDGILQNQKPNQQESADQATDPVLAKKALANEIARRKAAQAEQQALAKTRDQIQRELEAKGLKGAVEFQLDERGLVVNIVTDKVLFDTGDATLRADGAKVLAIIAPSIRKLPNHVTVEGHTDNVPVSGGGRFASNWELSTARATTVVRTLISDGLPSNRVAAAGYADQRPLSSNATAAGKARNRRVAIVVLPTVSQPESDKQLDALASSSRTAAGTSPAGTSSAGSSSAGTSSDTTSTGTDATDTTGGTATDTTGGQAHAAAATDPHQNAASLPTSWPATQE